ncbi:MAG: hypothetical protein RLZZ347_197 [Candidatus Parcubacteria bacterium]|jgi:hypothetical protein
MKRFAKILVLTIILASVAVVHHHHRKEMARKQAIAQFLKFVNEEMPKLNEADKRRGFVEFPDIPFPVITEEAPKVPANEAFTK